MDDDLLDMILDDLFYEAKVSKRGPVITQVSKIKRATGQMANNQAEKSKDPLYRQMQKYKQLYYKYRNLIHQKYGPRVRSKARR